MEEQSVLKQKPAKKAEKPAEKKAAGEQSVLGGGSSKPITFYKKPWFWIIIGVVVLGGAGLIVFLCINSAITAEAIEKYGQNAENAVKAYDEFESSYRSIYSDSGLVGYYGNSNQRSIDLRNKCLEKKNISAETANQLSEMSDSYDSRIYDGEAAVEKYGAGKTRELSDKFASAIDGLKDAKANISECKDVLKEALNNDVKIELGEFKIEEKTYWNDTSMSVKVTNTSDSSYRFHFKIIAKDDNGKQIDYDYITTKVIGKGESAEFEAFTSVYRSDEEKMKTAKFEIESLTEYN